MLIVQLFLLCACVALFFPQTAHAYIDPGTGSVIVQAIIAGVVGALFTIKLYWRRLVSFCSGLFRK